MEEKNLRDISCCFSGHRELPPATLSLKRRLTSTLCSLYGLGYRTFICGGALGFDTLAALAVLQLKKEKNDVSLHLYIPCADQAKSWQEADIKEYERIKSLADEVFVLSPTYTRGCMHNRNRAMVNASSVCVAYLKKNSGGTAYTVDYAAKKGLEIINLA